MAIPAIVVEIKKCVLQFQLQRVQILPGYKMLNCANANVSLLQTATGSKVTTNTQ